ncbi:hypothetical protein LZ31DRAFT_97693 [Colletotrichum somersetense]|nr:hypothetical protein LZ31DRAFT_97693 [Colletotrichum somersetense]
MDGPHVTALQVAFPVDWLFGMSFLFTLPSDYRTTRASSPGHVCFCLSLEMVSEVWECLFLSRGRLQGGDIDPIAAETCVHALRSEESRKTNKNEKKGQKRKN